MSSLKINPVDRIIEELLCNSKIKMNDDKCKGVVRYNYNESETWKNKYNVELTPLNIIKKNCVTSDRRFKIDYKKECNYKTIVNNNSRYIIPIDCSQIIIHNEESYELIQCHIHHESENKINNIIFDMEIHLVHKSKNDKILVMGLLLDVDDSECSLFPELLFESNHNSVNKYDFSILNQLESLSCYLFKGTLTTPPFTEGINWILFSPLEIIGLNISSKIYNIFTKECKHNSFKNNGSMKTKVYFRKKY